MRQRIKRYALIIIGCLSVLLGVIGAVLPLLPTTPFLLLALACFSRSSPRFHQLLLHNRWFGQTLQQWEQNRSISRSAKKKAMLMIIVTFSVSITVLHGRIYLQLGLLSLAILILVLMWRLKETEFNTNQ